VWRPWERLQKDAPRDIEEIQRKEGQSSDPVHGSVSVTHESQLRHEKAEKVKGKRGYRHIFTLNRDGSRNGGNNAAGILQKSLKLLVAPARIELTTNGLGNRCSIQLSYGATPIFSRSYAFRVNRWSLSDVNSVVKFVGGTVSEHEGPACAMVGGCQVSGRHLSGV
jgi:hypothetical protein